MNPRARQTAANPTGDAALIEAVPDERIPARYAPEHNNMREIRQSGSERGGVQLLSLPL